MRVVVMCTLALVMGVGAHALYQASVREAVPAVVHDDTLCRAKFANFVMRHEELSKPERERWDSFRAYMGGCVS